MANGKLQLANRKSQISNNKLGIADGVSFYAQGLRVKNVSEISRYAPNETEYKGTIVLTPERMALMGGFVKEIEGG